MHNGPRVFKLNYLVDQIEFVSILDNSSFRLNCLGALCHHLKWFFNLAIRLRFFRLTTGTTCIRSKFGHQVAPLAFVSKLAISWQHLQMLHHVVLLALHCHIPFN